MTAIILILFIWITPLWGQITKPAGYRFTSVIDRLGDNSVTDIFVHGPRIWFGTDGGLSVTENDGQSFTTYTQADGIGKGGISAIAFDGPTIWIATAFDSTINNETLDVGGGITYSSDHGATWTHIPQPVDPRGDTTQYKPTTTSVQNVTFDITLHNGEIWISSWGGGLRKSSDNGTSWQRVTTDGLPFDALGQLNHRGFAVISADNGLWVGTASGISKSVDSGESWTRYTATNGSGISGNFITALGAQRLPDKTVIWAATWEAEGETEFTAVSFTENDGLTWTVVLPGERAHNFAFRENRALIMTDTGAWITDDFGQTWARYQHIMDEGTQFLTTEFYSAAYNQNDLWIGSADGLALTRNNGLTWKIFRAFESPGVAGEAETYAYPNPFSPRQHNVFGRDGFVRIQYRTTQATEAALTIFDFALHTVQTIPSVPAAAGDNYVLWDGKNAQNDIASNGVYFYKLEVGGKTHWGKIVVLE